MNTTVILVVFISSAAYVMGGLGILWVKNRTVFGTAALTAVSAGLLLSIALLDLIPETLKNLHGGTPVLLGFLSMYIIQYGTRIYLNKKNAGSMQTGSLGIVDRTTLAGISTGMFLHNFFEGLSIGISYTVNLELGVLVSLAMILHKIPEGLSFSSLSFAFSGSRGRTAGLLVTQSLFAWLGAGTAVLAASSEHADARLNAAALSFTAGIFLYLAGSSLLPALNKQPGRRIPLMFIGGILIYVVLRGIADMMGN